MTSPGFLFMVALMIVFGIVLAVAAAMEHQRARQIQADTREALAERERRRHDERRSSRPGPGRRDG